MNNLKLRKKYFVYRMLTLTSSFSIAYVVLAVGCSNGLVELDLDDGIPFKKKFNYLIRIQEFQHSKISRLSDFNFLILIF
jgi:hypothetical protein